jgi:hypothetical protein
MHYWAACDARELTLLATDDAPLEIFDTTDPTLGTLADDPQPASNMTTATAATARFTRRMLALRRACHRYRSPADGVSEQPPIHPAHSPQLP